MNLLVQSSQAIVQVSKLALVIILSLVNDEWCSSPRVGARDSRGGVFLRHAEVQLSHFLSTGVGSQGAKIYPTVNLLTNRKGKRRGIND